MKRSKGKLTLYEYEWMNCVKLLLLACAFKLLLIYAVWTNLAHQWCHHRNLQGRPRQLTFVASPETINACACVWSMWGVWGHPFKRGVTECLCRGGGGGEACMHPCLRSVWRTLMCCSLLFVVFQLWAYKAHREDVTAQRWLRRREWPHRQSREQVTVGGSWREMLVYCSSAKSKMRASITLPRPYAIYYRDSSAHHPKRHYALTRIGRRCPV